MEDLHVNNTWQNNSDHDSDNSNYDYNYISNDDYHYDFNYIYNYIYNDNYNYNSDSNSSNISNNPFFVVTCTTISLGLPLNLIAICALFSQVRNGRAAPIYVINLLISDLIQFCCMIVRVVPHKDWKTYKIFFQIYIYSLLVSVCFMVCVALERYLVIACPLWYRFRRTIKVSVLVCVAVWVLPALCLLSVIFSTNFLIQQITYGIFFLLPFPLLIFFLGGTLRALSSSISVPSDEKRRIVGMLVLVLLIYTLLFLPGIISLLVELNEHKTNTESILVPVFLKFSPLADLVLYVFMRKGAIDRLLASVCCCRMDSNESRSPAVSVVTTCPQSA